MHQFLPRQKVEKRSFKIRFSGRALFLTKDADLLKRQLAGENLAWQPDIKLRDDISTDEITPAHVGYYTDETLGEFPYLGLKCGNEFPVTRGSVKRGGFVVSVSGKRRGKGSSREHSPYSEKCAGIQVIVAENIERIYRQNALNLGLLVTTNFDLIEKIQRGEEIRLDEFTRGEDDITRQIIEYGGLYNYNVARLQGAAMLPQITTPGRPMTIAEKILAKHFIVDAADNTVGVRAVAPGDSGFARTDLRFSHEFITPLAVGFFNTFVGKDAPVTDPETILCFRDHLNFIEQVMPAQLVEAGFLDRALNLRKVQADFAQAKGIRVHGDLPDRPGAQGILHMIVLEQYARPGNLMVGSDSHTPHSGALGSLAIGIGATDLFNAWITKDVRVRVPETIKIVVRGRKPANVTAKDIVLEICRLPFVKVGGALGKVLEFCGPAVETLSIDERATMTNMAAEIGGFTGIVATATADGTPDPQAVEFLMTHRGLARAEAERWCAPWFSDREAQYAHVIEIDASTLRPMIARPGDPGNGMFVDEFKDQVKVDIAYGGSCTAGKIEDMDMYAQVFRRALTKGKHIAPGVQCYIQFGSQAVHAYAAEKGYLSLFRAMGAQILEPSCGACCGQGPGSSISKDQVTISSQNRNFPGRSGPGQVYLASPYTVAASAIAGKIVAAELDQD